MMKIENCTRCKKQIPYNEQAYLHKGNVICHECDEVLSVVKAELVTIELTEKKWKTVMVFGLFIILLGIFTTEGSFSFIKQWFSKSPIFAIGVFVFLVGKFLAWWNHG
jgi:di/tricarboxylate transporter